MTKRKSVSKTDAFVNAMTGLGTSDPITKTIFQGNLRLSQVDAESYFTSHWINRRAVEVIPEDCFRKGVEIKIDDDNDVKKILGKIETIKAISEFEKASNLGRIYGGALLILGINDGALPEKPLNVNKIKSVDFIYAVDRWKINVFKKYDDPLKPKYNQPELYSITNKLGQIFKIHESRTLRFNGDWLPDNLLDQNDGWCDSIYVAILDSLKQYASCMDNGATLFQDFVTKVLKLPNLMELVQRGKTGDQALDKRINYANSKMANFNIALIGENEELTKIASSVAGLKELMDLYIEAVCGCIKTPRTRIFGQQLGVLAGATEQTRNYYDMVASWANKNVKDQMETFLRYIIIAELGKEPEDWSWSFPPLWQDTQKEILDQRKVQADIDAIYISNQVVTPEEVSVSRFTDRGFSFDTHIEMDLRGSDDKTGTQTANSEQDKNKPVQ